MKVQELRIGNFVERINFFTDNQWGIHQISLIDLIDISRYPYHFRPIILTEEWVVKFGLKENPKHTVFHIKGMQFEISTMIGGYYDNELGLDQESKIELKYVHQLQNIYFALTGEELTII